MVTPMGSMAHREEKTEEQAIDLAAVVRDALGCEAVYASSDPRQVRCLVEHPHRPQVAEWLVHALPRQSDQGFVEGKAHDAHAPPFEDARVSLESHLEDILRLRVPAQRKSQRARLKTEGKQARSGSTQTSGAVRHGMLDALYTDIPVYSAAQEQTSRDNTVDKLFRHRATPRASCLRSLRGIYESVDGQMFAIFEYAHNTLRGVMHYKRHLLEDSIASDVSVGDMKKRFVAYQLCQLIQFLHARHMTSSSPLSPSNVLLSDSLLMQLGDLPVWISDDETGRLAGGAVPSTTFLPRSVEATTSQSLTERWCDGSLSSFEYLMKLNTAAGRRIVDAAFHPVLPWVSDFSARYGGWRDLSKTKFRLTRGDYQLDRTYESSMPPHHIPESLSEITYYIYMARRTPMAVLRHVVRSNFQPKEYPSTLERMYTWSPDECIPEFFMDATAFSSIHSDGMNDLSLPDWCEQDPHDFIRTHRAMLESDEVAEHLPAWIDLTFGICLTGEAAVRHKNVPLFVSLHGDFAAAAERKSPGFVQLFDRYHPRRQIHREYTESMTTSGTPTAQAPGRKDDVGRKHSCGSLHSTIALDQRNSVSTMLRTAVAITNDAGTLKNARISSSIASIATSSTLVSPANHANDDIHRSVRFQSTNGQSAEPVASPPPAPILSSSLTRSFKQKLKSKPRANLNSADAIPASPSVSTSNSHWSSRTSPTVSRFTSALPKFFGSDTSHSRSSLTSRGVVSHAGQLSASQPRDEVDTSITASRSSIISRSGEDGSGRGRDLAIDSSTRSISLIRQTPTPPLLPSTSSVSSSPPKQSSLHSSSANHLNHNNGTGSHLFRDLWQQLSRPDGDDGSESTVTENSSANSSELNWTDSDFDSLDDISLKLLSAALPIEIPLLHGPPDDHRCAYDPMLPCVYPQAVDEGPLISPAYAIPHGLLQHCPLHDREMSSSELKMATDVFSLGCLIAEIYSTRPLFSSWAAEEYIRQFIGRRRTNTDSNSNAVDRPLSPGDEPVCCCCDCDQVDTHGIPVTCKCGNLDLAELHLLPLDIKLLHPYAKRRLTNFRFIEKYLLHVSSGLPLSKPLKDNEAARWTREDAGMRANSFEPILFPRGLHVIQNFVVKLHQQASPLDRLDLTRRYLPEFRQLPDPLFYVCLPVLTQFFRAESFYDTICVDHVATAVIYLLPMIAERVGSTTTSQILLSHIIRLYEHPSLPAIIKLSLGSPAVLRDLVRAFGLMQFVDVFLPVLVEWLVSPPPSIKVDTKSTSKSPNVAAEQASQNQSRELFGTEVISMLMIAFSELASTDHLGPSFAAKYLLPLVLARVGKVRTTWIKLKDKKQLVRHDLRSANGGSEGNGKYNTLRPALGGRHGDGVHAAFVDKLTLLGDDGDDMSESLRGPLQPHVTNAVLLMCRELPESAVCSIVLPSLCDAATRLVAIAEDISAVRIDGVPVELAREVHLTLRCLRHVVHGLSDRVVERELVYHRSGMIVDLLNKIRPPFIHPRTVDALLHSMVLSDSNHTSSRPERRGIESPELPAEGSPPSLLGHNSEPITRERRAVVNRLLALRRDGNSQNLRAFTAVGLARLITTIFQKLGSNAITAAAASNIAHSSGTARMKSSGEGFHTSANSTAPTGGGVGLMPSSVRVQTAAVVQSANAFLVRCAAIYSELEISDFQWRMASEVVYAFCQPLRTIVGPDAFPRLFPSVASSSVLQMLLLPASSLQTISASSEGSSSSNLKQHSYSEAEGGRMGVDAAKADQLLRQQHQDQLNEQQNQVMNELRSYSPGLLAHAYRAARVNGIKTTGFLHLSRHPVFGNDGSSSHDLNEEVFLVQEERKKRRSTSGKLGSNTCLAWVRPLVADCFVSTTESLSPSSRRGVSGTNDGDGRSGGYGVTSSAPPPRICSSWFFHGEVVRTVRAHGSGIQSISVDGPEEFVLTANRNGSCRVWPVATMHQSQQQHASHAEWGSTAVSPSSTNSVFIDKGLRSVQFLSESGLSSYRALALSATTVHVWDVRSSHVTFKMPLDGHQVVGATQLRQLPFRLHESDFSDASSPGSFSRCTSSVIQGPADFAVATSRNLYMVDMRAGPRVVADWRVDPHDSTWVTTLSLLISSGNAMGGLLMAGTATGRVVVLDKRTGRRVMDWQALLEGARVLLLQQYAPEYILVVGADREARVWHLPGTKSASTGATPFIPRLCMILTYLPESLRASQICVQSYTDMSVLYIASAAKVIGVQLPTQVTSTNGGAVITTRLEAVSLLDTTTNSEPGGLGTTAIQTPPPGGPPSNSRYRGEGAALSYPTAMGSGAPSGERHRSQKAKLNALSVGVLPLRQIVLVGAEDGNLSMCI